MERIDIQTVLKKVVEVHYKDGIDWRLIDGEERQPIPYDYRKQGFIYKTDFEKILLSQFECTETTIRTKWKVLAAQGVFREQIKLKKAYIDLVRVKNAVPEFRLTEFSYSLYLLNEKNTQKTHTQKNDFSEAIE